MKCDKSLSFEECELSILRTSVDKMQKSQATKLIQNEETKTIIEIVEKFIQKNNCICYGGTAINNILPKEAQFYDKKTEFPDYDFYSPNALKHAKELADLYLKKGFTLIEAKSGVHHGTYKVFVNYLPVADITQIDDEIFATLKKESISRNKILYCSPNFLRMGMYLELSRPLGDVSRWEKVLKRISLLNKHYPLLGEDCKQEAIQRLFESTQISESKVYETLRNIFVDNNCVFFGAMAYRLYSKYIPEKEKCKIKKIPDFDILAENPVDICDKIVNIFSKMNYKDVNIVEHEPIGEIISRHYEVIIDKDTVAFIYEPLACHSYNIINKSKSVRVATIDTMMSFYLAFLSVNRTYYNKNRLLCICEFLFKIQQKNRLKQKGLLKRFSMNCIGTQPTLISMRKEKSDKFEELKNKRNSKEWEEWFLTYSPSPSVKKSSTSTSTSKSKSKTKKKVTSKSKSKTVKK